MTFRASIKGSTVCIVFFECKENASSVVWCYYPADAASFAIFIDRSARAAGPNVGTLVKTQHQGAVSRIRGT
jgi:hypothetical protein